MTGRQPINVNGTQDPTSRLALVDEDFREEFKAQNSHALYYQERRYWTPEVWQKHQISKHKGDHWRTLPKSITWTHAYLRLSLPGREVLRLACGEVKWLPKPSKTNKAARRNPWGEHDPTPFCLPYAMVQSTCLGPNAKGLNSQTSVAKAIQECVDAGFLDRVTSEGVGKSGRGTKGKLSQFKLSCRFMAKAT